MIPYEYRKFLIYKLRLPNWYVVERLEMSNDMMEGLVERGYIHEPCECGGGTGRILTGTKPILCECNGDILLRQPNLKEYFKKNAEMREKNKLILDHE